jgi:hypothetical protein
MDLSNQPLCLCLRLETRGQAKKCDVRMKLHDLLKCRNRYIDFCGGLAAMMLTGSPMAITRHLLAAVHFRLGHLVIWQTSKSRRDRPQKHKSHDQNGTDRRHFGMLHPGLRSVQGSYPFASTDQLCSCRKKAATPTVATGRDC